MRMKKLILMLVAVVLVALLLLLPIDDWLILGPTAVIDRGQARVESEWDPAPQFWGLWLPAGGQLQGLPPAYVPLALPRRAGEYVFIGGSQPWRGLRITVETPNANAATLVSECWNGTAWKACGIDRTRFQGRSLAKSGDVDWGVVPWALKTLTSEAGTTSAYWVRLSVTADLSQDVAGSLAILHDAPTLTSEAWKMWSLRVSACDNRPGLKMIYVTVKDKDGQLVRGVRVGFDTEPGEGVAYDHMNIWGVTDENGYLEWNHLGVPTVYRLWVGGEMVIGNIRTDLGNEYCKPPGSAWWTGNVPVNRPGIYSYRIELQKKE